MTEIREQTLPEDADSRNDYPLDDGLFGYFAAALAEVAKVSKVGNDQHNPGQPMHWDRSKSRDHGNKLLRHHLDAGKLDTDGLRHTAKRAWRALADLQEELEREGAPIARNARNADTHDHLKPKAAPIVDRAYDRQNRIGAITLQLRAVLSSVEAVQFASEIDKAAEGVADGLIHLGEAREHLINLVSTRYRPPKSRVG